MEEMFQEKAVGFRQGVFILSVHNSMEMPREAPDEAGHKELKIM